MTLAQGGVRPGIERVTGHTGTDTAPSCTGGRQKAQASAARSGGIEFDVGFEHRTGNLDRAKLSPAHQPGGHIAARDQPQI